MPRWLIAAPVHDYLAALERCLMPRRWSSLAFVVLGLAIGWFVYVPLHELLHAFGCLATGGEVTRLEIDPIYGAAWLQKIFPWVAVGSDYAGQLTGFDTHGNDLIYLATDLAPFVLTVVIGVPLLRRVAAAGLRLSWRCFLFGVAIPVAYAPFISLPGDYYEMGSIIVSHLVALRNPGLDVTRWRSDDLFKLAENFLGRSDAGGFDAAVVVAAFLVGALLSIVTYALGVWVSRWIVPRAA